MTIPYRVVIGEPCDEEEIKKLIEELFKEIDTTFNNWNPHSEISKLNRLAPGEKITLTPMLADFLKKVDQVVEKTDGLFDPTIAPIQQLWRAKLEREDIPTLEELEALRPLIGWKRLHIERNHFWKEASSQLDLGGIAKGHAVDLMAERLQSLGLNHFLIAWGGEIYAKGTHPSKRVWQIATPEGIKPLYNEAVATSGDSQQFWETDQGIYTHICHPKTLQAIKIESIGKSTTVTASTCLEADGLATAKYLKY